MDRVRALQRIFREVFDDETLQITPETSTASIDGWDSVAQVKIVLTVEAEFGIRLLTEEVSRIKSVGDILTVLATHLGS